MRHEKSERSCGEKASGGREQTKHTTTRKDYWDSIADDVADGYRKGSRGRGIYNEDQERDDNRRGDEVA